MQFRRFHAAAFLALGALLLLVQVYVVFAARANVARTSPPDQEVQTGPVTAFVPLQLVDYVPGVLGLALVAFGGYVMVQGQKQRLEAEDPQNFRTHGSSQA